MRLLAIFSALAAFITPMVLFQRALSIVILMTAGYLVFSTPIDAFFSKTFGYWESSSQRSQADRQQQREHEFRMRQIELQKQSEIEHKRAEVEQQRLAAERTERERVIQAQQQELARLKSEQQRVERERAQAEAQRLVEHRLQVEQKLAEHQRIRSEAHSITQTTTQMPTRSQHPTVVVRESNMHTAISAHQQARVVQANSEQQARAEALRYPSIDPARIQVRADSQGLRMALGIERIHGNEFIVYAKEDDCRYNRPVFHKVYEPGKVLTFSTVSEPHNHLYYRSMYANLCAKFV